MASNTATANVSVDALAEALAQAIKQVNRPEPVAKGPTDRVKACAAAINAGASAFDAMVGSGYSRKFAQHNAAGFPSFLAKQGLLKQEPDRVYVGVVAPVEKPEVEIKEEAE